MNIIAEIIFVIGNFMNFKMVDIKPVLKQVEELQVITHDLEVEGMRIKYNVLVGAIIEKFLFLGRISNFILNS